MYLLLKIKDNNIVINNGNEKVYLASADWMDRNFFRRVELAFPIFDQTLKKRVIDENFVRLVYYLYLNKSKPKY